MGTVPHTHRHTQSRPCSSSSEYLSSVQLLPTIISHQQIRVHFLIKLYIYWLFRHPPSGYPISYQLSSPPIISDYFCTFTSPDPPYQTLFQFIIKPKSSSIIVTHHPPPTEQRISCHQIIYPLLIQPPPIMIPYTRSIIVTPHYHITSPLPADHIPVHQKT